MLAGLVGHHGANARLDREQVQVRKGDVRRLRVRVRGLFELTDLLRGRCGRGNCNLLANSLVGQKVLSRMFNDSLNMTHVVDTRHENTPRQASLLS